MYERPPPLVLSGSLPPGGVAVGDEDAGLAARHKAEVFEPVDRQMREGVVDHQVVDVVVRDAGLGKGRGAGDAEGARGGEVRHLGDHRRLGALAGAEEVDRPPVRCQGQALREVAGALGRNQDQRTAAIGHHTTQQEPERVGDHPRVQHVLDGDRRPRVSPPGPRDKRGLKAHGRPGIARWRIHNALHLRPAVWFGRARGPAYGASAVWRVWRRTFCDMRRRSGVR